MYSARKEAFVRGIDDSPDVIPDRKARIALRLDDRRKSDGVEPALLLLTVSDSARVCIISLLRNVGEIRNIKLNV